MARSSRSRRFDPKQMDRKDMRSVYVASPYTIGPCARNVSTQIEAFHRLMDMGLLPFAPLLTHYAEIHRQRPWEDWIHNYCLPWVSKCDMVLRLEGLSIGGDLEVQQAHRLNIPVYFGWQDLEDSLG